MTGFALLTVGLALATSGQVGLAGGSTAPERLVQRFDVECGGRTGALVLEERFDRSAPARTFKIDSFTPLGSKSSKLPSESLIELSKQMTRVDRVTWLCDQRRVTLFIEYFDRASYDEAVRNNTSSPNSEQRRRRVVLILNERELSVEPDGKMSVTDSKARDVNDVIAKLNLSTFANSVGPRRKLGKATFADYQFITAKRRVRGADLIRNDKGWMMGFDVLSSTRDVIDLCFYDRGMKQPGRSWTPSYNAISALRIIKSSTRLWSAQEVRGGFRGCRNNPPAA